MKLWSLHTVSCSTCNVINGVFMTTNQNPDIPSMAFEKALGDLEQIVQKLERGEVALEESIALYERGEALKKRCETLLGQAETRIEKITLGSDGQPKGTESLEQ